MPRKSTTEQKTEFVTRQRSYDPQITQENYKIDLSQYLTYHNIHSDYKKIRQWALGYAKGVIPDYEILDRASDFEIRTIGIIGHAISRGNPISDMHKKSILDSMVLLIEKYKPKKASSEIVQPRVVAKVENKTAQVISTHVAEINAAIDDYLTTGVEFSAKAYFSAQNVSAAIAKQIPEHFRKLEAELKEAIDGGDTQLKEGYAHLGKVKLKRFHAMVQQIIVDCAQQIVTAKVRAPRVKKEKPPTVLAAKMKYQRTHNELKLTSESPVNIIGSNTVWLYDTQRRKLTVYVADDKQTLSIKGTVITGFSVTESMTKIVRKPESILVGGNFAKKALHQTFTNLKTTPSLPNGRTNENMIILKVFK